MALLRWQWTLANGGSVEATIDEDFGTETVSQASNVLSQCERAAKPEGHVVLVAPERVEGRSERPPIEAVVTFAPTAAICILRVDGHEVAPSAWPVKERAARPPEAHNLARTLLIAVAVALLIGAGLAVRALRQDPSPQDDGKLHGTHRSPNGLFVAHFPNDLTPRLAVLPPAVGGVVLENKVKSISLVIASLTFDGSSAKDPWVLQQTLRDEALANLPKGAGKYEESSRREETCLGKPGAVVVGYIMLRGVRQGRVWSCAFVHEDSGYLMLSMIAEPTSAAEERHVRAILDATELTHLSDLGMPGLVDPASTIDLPK